MENPTAEEINEYIENFYDIYQDGEEINPLPSQIPITVYCEGNDPDDIGFGYNVYKEDLGLNLLIAQKWIYQKDLDDLMYNN